MGREARLTLPDLVVLHYLGREPMHGHQLDRTLVRHDVKDWAAISRPQVYYSIKKLAALGLLEPVSGAGPAAGPDRQVHRTTRSGREALAGGLAAEQWATQRPPPPFLSWLALASRARKPDVRRLVARRRDFLDAEIARERQTLQQLEEIEGLEGELARLMVSLTLDHFATERTWLDRVESAFEDRARRRK